MADFAVSLSTLLLVIGGSAVGFYLQGVLLERHRDRDTLDAVRLVVSILVTFTAIVLGLVTSSVKSSHDLFDTRLRGFAGHIIELDQRLREYGDVAAPIRAKLRTYVAAAIADTWRDEPRPSGVYPTFAPVQGAERELLGDLLMDVDNSIDKWSRMTTSIASSRRSSRRELRAHKRIDGC